MENETTKVLHQELAKREGVTEVVIGPHETFKIVTDQGEQESTGPARILINID
ncbi:BC1881 family protein [Sporosarcina sp. Marseille-Q4943]|uniref:BC1881 family protein n=1 Tax=Sporosarcina sp. Marseille-Q4943 TaxID=2942204 RepID=UPI00208DD85B|nr:BC1881 family protein [Sporosarcina sp. Marseille-Q4943]